MVEKGDVVEDELVEKGRGKVVVKDVELSRDDEDELENIINEDDRSSFSVVPRLSKIVVPSLEMSSVVEGGSLEEGVKNVVVDSEDEEIEGQYGAEQSNYLSAGGDYESAGGGDYDSGGIEVDGGSQSDVVNPMMSDGGYPGMGRKKKKDKQYHSAMDTVDEERKKREKEKKTW